MMSLLFSLALAAASGDPAAAATTPGTRAVKPAKPKKVCERIESTGSSVPKKICRTVKAPQVEIDAANTAPGEPAGNSTN